MRAEQFPIELRQTAQWILWKRERRGDKIHKAHFNARTGKPASSTDPNTWSTFDDAVEGLKVFGECDGLGFVFSADDRFVGVDLDDCVDEAGEVAEWAREIVSLIGSYAELSQSGRGIHTIAIGDLPPEGRKKGPIEMYSDGRFFVMTGNHLPGTPDHIEPREEAIHAVHRQVFGSNGAAGSNGAHLPRPVAPPLLTDESELIEKARAADARFDQLWRGDFSAYGSQSEADLALLGKLAFWCGRDQAAMDRLFRQSGLCREKWTKREYYRNRTLAKAVAECVEVYTPHTQAVAVTRRRTVAMQPRELKEGAALSEKPSDQELAEVWAGEHRNQFLFAEGDEWWEYRGTAWSPVSLSTIHAQIYAWLKQQGRGRQVDIKQRRIREISSLGESILGEGARPVPRSAFNPDRSLIPLANGMLDLNSRQIRDHSPAYRNTYCLPYGYDEQAKCPLFRRFLSEVMLTEEHETCVEWCRTLVEWMGYCLIPDSRAETVLVNVGEGGNGKSLWTRVLEGLVGDMNCDSIDPRQLEMQPAYTLASLYGKLVGFLNEPTKSELQGCSRPLKAIASGDPVEARRPYGQPFAYRPHVRLVISANDLPDTRDLSHGYFRKILVIEWRFRPATPDRELDRKLLAELPGILNLALDGLDHLRGRGYDFGEPVESQALKKEYRFAQDTVAQFLDVRAECDAKSVDLWSLPAVLYDGYAAWCKRSGYQPMTVCGFGRHLTKRLGFAPTRSHRDDATGKVFTVRYGIRLKGDWDDL